MLNEQFIRTISILGNNGFNLLLKSHVMIFGIGGVGGYALEALVRSGIGEITIIDNDKISISNLNRQIIATHKTIGQYKVDAAEKRLLDINPNLKVNKYNLFFNSETASKIDFTKVDYIIDAIDTVSSKVLLVELSQKYSIPIISSMGAGNKIEPTMFEVTDIFKTSVCPLARVMRQELKKRGIKNLKVVYSKEEPVKINSKNNYPSSIAFVPSVVGLIIACEVIKDLTKYK